MHEKTRQTASADCVRVCISVCISVFVPNDDSNPVHSGLFSLFQFFSNKPVAQQRSSATVNSIRFRPNARLIRQTIRHREDTITHRISALSSYYVTVEQQFSVIDNTVFTWLQILSFALMHTNK